MRRRIWVSLLAVNFLILAAAGARASARTPDAAPLKLYERLPLP